MSRMSNAMKAVHGFDGLVHVVKGGAVRVSYVLVTLEDRGVTGGQESFVTSTTCKYICTGSPAPAGLLITDDTVTCLGCIAAEAGA